MGSGDGSARQVRFSSDVGVVEATSLPCPSGIQLSLELIAGAAPDGVLSRDAGLEAAARLILRADALSMVDIARGRPVTVVASRAEPPIAARVPTGASEDEYRRSRPPLRHLVWPLLAAKPSLGSLYEYQREGVDWLSRTDSAVLADDMGLGKTVTTLMAIAGRIAEGEAGTALVVAPKSLLGTWQREAVHWTPWLTSIQLAPSIGMREGAWRSVLGRFHLAFTNYESIRELPDAVAAYSFSVLVLDEAHRTRRLDAAVTKSVRSLISSRIWALTGTPIERDQKDLVTILSTISPNHFSPSDEGLPASTLKSRAKPFVLRRTKEEVLGQLPAAIDRVEWLQLSEEQRRSYDRVKSKATRAARRHESVIQYIGELRAICDLDPATGVGTKLERAGEISSALAERGEKGVIFSYLLAPLDSLEAVLRREGVRYRRLDGGMTGDEREQSLSDFRERDDVSLLLASTRVASEGLTLTEANNVIFINEWWNPSNNAQARDRVVRIGQTRVVNVYRLRCEETVEEALSRLLEDKKDIFNRVVGALEGRTPLDESVARRLLA